MPILSYDEIDKGIDKVVTTQASAVPGLSAAEWAYLLKLTAFFEGALNFMYSNKDLPGVSGPDVTVGVGISLPNRASVQATFNTMTFYVKGTNYAQPATLEQVQADYDTVAGMSRLSNKLDDYYKAVATELAPMDALKKLPVTLGKLASDGVKLTEFKDFAAWPAQARVALCSYCYGISPAGAPEMRKQLAKPDFDEAGRQSYIAGWSANKVLAHRKLFWNAARLAEAKAANSGADIAALPARFDGGIVTLPAPAGKTPSPRAPDTAPP